GLPNLSLFFSLSAPANAQIVHSGQACVVKEDNISERIYTIREGDTLVLQCLVKGHPRPQVRWTKTAGSASDKFQDTPIFNETLRIDNIQRVQGGRYYCKAENGVGVAAIKSIRVDVQCKPGLTTTAICAVDLQGAGGNWATVGRRSRGGRRVHRQREKRKGKSVGLRIGTLNVGTMTGKGRELADMMERRKVDILCVQETRWKGSKAHSIGAGFKLFYYGVDSKRNGVGVVLKEEFVRNVLEVKRVSDRVMSLKLEIEGVMLNVVSGYAPQVGCELGEKERFWSELDEVMESIPTGERVVIGADFNGHVGEGNRGDEEVMGKELRKGIGVKERDLEGHMVVDYAKRMDMAVVNAYFQKREEHRVTYKSVGWSTQVDYILCRRGNLKEIVCKVVVGESVARQDRMVVCRMTLMVCKKKRSEIEKKTKWWKLKKEKCWWSDLEKAYDRVPREELWYCMRKSGVAEKYVRVVQDMYERSRTVVRCAVGQTEEFKAEVRLHQGSALSPFLFAMVMDQLSEEEWNPMTSALFFQVLSILKYFSAYHSWCMFGVYVWGVCLGCMFGVYVWCGISVPVENGILLVEEVEEGGECTDRESIPTGERVVIGADFNGHVGEENTGDEEVMGKFGVKERNLEGQMVVDFAKRMDMAVVNTYFQKREEHRVTYKSGGRSTQVDYILCRRGNLKEISDCKVLVGESVARQHRMVVCRMTLMVCKKKRRKEDKETWWWNEEVQDSIQRKRLAKKKWDMDRTEENRQEYNESQRRVKREVSKAKKKAYDELYTRLDTREGEKDLYRLARQRDRDGKDVQQVRVIKDRDGRVLTSEESVQRRWKEYFEELMNEENEREKRVEGVNSVEQKVDKIRKDEVRKALKRMKSGKAVGPDDIPVEVWKCLGEAAVEFLTSLFNRVLENLEKAYDRVPREELWYCMRKSGVAEKYVRVVQDMYERSRTVVRCAVGQTEEFKVEVRLHQGSALSPFLFAIVMDQLSEEVRQESPWTMMFADDIVICSESREQVEENLERWRFALERRGMKVSRSKTEYMCVNEREGSGTVRLQGEEVKKVQEFKYLGSTVQSNGECGKEVKKQVQAGWNGWRKVSGVLCDRKISARIKGKVYTTVVRPAMLNGLETVSLRKRQESELEVAELKMLRFSLGVTRLDRIRKEYIRGTAHVGRLGDKVRETRLRRFGHVQRRESEYIGRRMLDMELPGRRQRGRPKRRTEGAANQGQLMEYVMEWNGIKVCLAEKDKMYYFLKTSTTPIAYLDKPMLTVHQTISDVRGNYYQEKTVFLRCTVNSNPPARFIWKRGNVPIEQSKDNGVDIYEPLYTQGETKVLKLKNLRPQDFANYTCQVSVRNVCDIPDTSVTFRLTNTTTPPALKLSVNETYVVDPGQDVTMSCEVTAGFPTPTVTWARFPTPLPRRAIIRGGSLTLRSAIPADSGFYNCTAVNNVGNPARRNVNLIVRTMKNLTFQITPDSNKDSESIQMGRDLKLSCHVDAQPQDKVNYTWYKNAAPVNPSDSLIVLRSDPDMPPGTSSLEIVDMKFRDQATYSCVANFPGSNVPELRVDINITQSSVIPPVLSVPVGGSVVNASECGNTELVCLVEGKPRPPVLWSRANKDMPMPSGEWVTETRDGRLRLTNVTRDMAGAYRCQTAPYNGLNIKRRLAQVQLNVEYPPVVDPVYQDVRSPNYKPVILRCIVLKSNPNRIASARWYRNMIPIRTPPVDPQDVPQLRFILDPTNNGTYECKVSNGVGTSSCIFLVSARPYIAEFYFDTPNPIRILKGSNYSYNLQWTQREPNTTDKVIGYWISVQQCATKAYIYWSHKYSSPYPRAKVISSYSNLEKAYDRVPREELWYCMRKSGVAEKYVRVVQDMYERSRTVVRCAVGQTEEFNVEVGLHQGSALSPFLFAVVMDQLSEEVRQESPWTMMFADDIVICSESMEQVEESLERWRFALEKRGIKVSRSKTEYMCVNEREGSGTVRLQGEEVKKMGQKVMSKQINTREPVKGVLMSYTIIDLRIPLSYEVCLTPITAFGTGDTVTRTIQYSEHHVCGFEDARICGFSQDRSDVFDWTRQNHLSQNPKRSVNTGPDTDRSGTKEGYYMYIETSRPRQKGDKARLLSPLYNVTAARGPSGSSRVPYCVSFFYHMNGKHIASNNQCVGVFELQPTGSIGYTLLNTLRFTGTLNVLLRVKGIATVDSLAWTLSGHQGSNWRKANVVVYPSGPFQVVFEGIRGDGFEGDIAIDDVSVTKGKCKQEKLPETGCELEEKERFWSELDEVMESIPTGEKVVIGADFNGHVGEENTGDEEVMGKFGVKERNLEGQMVVDFAKRMDMAVVNTYFQKREEHRVTYKSGDVLPGTARSLQPVTLTELLVISTCLYVLLFSR
ncbi:hypothetical protein QTP86_014847, partial [Hemibagrus guttatus]